MNGEFFFMVRNDTFVFWGAERLAMRKVINSLKKAGFATAIFTINYVNTIHWLYSECLNIPKIIEAQMT